MLSPLFGAALYMLTLHLDDVSSDPKGWQREHIPYL